jgi:phosphonate transport system substrate-binding protein
MTRRALLALPTLAAPALAQPAALRFAVGPFQPTAGDTRRTYEPFFAHLAAAVGRPHQLTVTTDWAGIAVAVANGQVDCAWMGPWGFVLAKDRANAQALAVVHYGGRPTYQAIILARPDLAIARFPEDARGMSISFADAGSTSGWLIPHHWFRSRGIDPRTFFRYRDGASHAANVVPWPTGRWTSRPTSTATSAPCWPRVGCRRRRHASSGDPSRCPTMPWPCAATLMPA